MSGIHAGAVMACRRCIGRRHRHRAAVPSADLVPMQFRMPPDFAMQFKLAAVKRNMKYNELLEVCFQQFMKSEGEA